MSSDDFAIRIQDLSKCFHIYNTPQDRLKQFVAPRLQRIVGATPSQYFQEFWALKDVSFEVKKGQTVGIVGRNGSGKSTLLQIICGTLTPTSGGVETRGRIAALLELGSGFNPEFTGRENVYMNAAILGLSHKEVDERFDDIITFADIGDFIEQPVKTYSSGMVLRLAFAVIAHVDADILVVDEALAVGDVVFTQRCMRFIRAFQKKGTLLFVSHDMGAVQNLCQQSVWLNNGITQLIGPSTDVAKAYLQSNLQEDYGDDFALETVTETAKPPKDGALPAPDDIEKKSSPAVDYKAHFTVTDNLSDASGWNTGLAEITGLSLEKLEGEDDQIFVGGERVQMTIYARANAALDRPILGFLVKDRLGQDLFGENTLPFTDVTPRTVEAGLEFSGKFVFTLPMLPNGEYSVMASVANGTLYDNVQHHYLHDALIINVSSGKVRWGLVGVPFEEVTLEFNNDR